MGNHLTRGIAAEQRALRAAIRDTGLLKMEASAVRIVAALHAAGERILPMTGPDPRDQATWGLIDAWDDEADTEGDLIVALAPWVQRLTEIMTAVGRPTDEPGDTDPPVYDAYGQPTTDDVLAMLADAERFHDDPDVQNLAGFASKEIDRLRALVGGRSAAPTRAEVRKAVMGARHRPDSRRTLGELYEDAVWDAITDAVLGLLSRSAAEPPEERGRVRVELTPDDLDGGYVAECVSLPGCISQGDTVPEALVNLADAYAAIKSGVAAEPNEEHDDGR